MQPQVPDVCVRRAASSRRPRFEPPLYVLRRRKWLALVVILVGLTAAVSMVVALPDIYEASATVLIERPQVPETFVRPTVTSGIDNRLQFLNQQILSYDRLAGLIERFDLYSGLRQQVPLEEAVARMQTEIAVEPQEDTTRRHNRTTTAFTLSYRGDEPEKIAEVANTLVSFYIKENVKVREQQAAGTTEFLQIQLNKLRQQLEQQEDQLSQFKEQHIGELPEQLQANLATLERLNTQLLLVSDKLTRAHEQRTALRKQITDAEQLMPTSPVTQESAVAQLPALYEELAALQTRYSDKYPDVISLRSKIASLEQHLATATPDALKQQAPTLPPSPLVQRLQQELNTLTFEIKALKAEERHLGRSITDYQQRVENTPRREQELQVLLRDYETTQDLYRELLKQQEEAKLAASLEQRQQGEQFRLLAPATPPKTPAAPPRPQLFLGGLMLSLALGIGVVFLVDTLDSSFHVVDDLRNFSPIPVLVSLPRIVTRADARRHRWRFGLATVSVVLGLGLLAVSLYTMTKGDFPSFHLPPSLAALNLPLREFFGS